MNLFTFTKCTLIFLLFFLTASITQAAVTITGNVTPIDPSSWTSSSVCHIGSTSDGSLAINGGNTIFSENAILGFELDVAGTVTISDMDSTWNSTNLHLGDDGYGELSIINGGKTSSVNSILGLNPRSIGTVNVTGSGSTWENGGDLTVGLFGNGQLNITDGGLVRVAGTFTIDAESNNNSFVNLATGGTLALFGEAESSLASFMSLVQGSDAIRWWDESLNDWSLLTTATPDTSYTLEYLNDYTLLTIQKKILPGDVNGDGLVDGSDVTILASNWQTLTGATLSMGDLNGDGAVDGADITILASNWQVGPYSNTVTIAPEPGALLMLLFGLLALEFIRRIK